MSTRCPAHVKRTAATEPEGTVSLLFRLLRIGIGLAALLVAFVVATGYMFIFPRTDPPGHADAVVVLSGGHNWRLDPALELMRRGVAPTLVISAVALDPNWTKAHRICRDGLPDKKVLCPIPDPYSTRGEARMIARLARQHGWHKIDVVTSRYHVFRARIVIRRCYHGELAMVGTHYPWLAAPLDWLSEWGKLIVQETVERSC